MGISGLRPGLFAGPLFAGPLFAGSLFIAAAIGAGGASAAPTPCEVALAAFNKDVKAATRKEAAVNSFYSVTEEPTCESRDTDVARAKLIDFLVGYAGKHPAEAADAIKLAERTVEVSGNWRGKAKLGDYYWDHRSNPGVPDALKMAYLWYQRSVLDFGTAEPKPTDAEKKVVLNRAYAAGNLANNDQEGHRTITPIPPMRDITGKLSGIYSSEFRSRAGAAVFKIPVPIQFYTNQASPTTAGDQSIRELAEAAKNVDAMALVGHADPRGDHKHNWVLSCDRVKAVADALVEQYHVTAKVTTSCKGDTQPYDTSSVDHPETLTPEEKWQLDRRVEFSW